MGTKSHLPRKLWRTHTKFSFPCNKTFRTFQRNLRREPKAKDVLTSILSKSPDCVKSTWTHASGSVERCWVLCNEIISWICSVSRCTSFPSLSRSSTICWNWPCKQKLIVYPPKRATLSVCTRNTTHGNECQLRCDRIDLLQHHLVPDETVVRRRGLVAGASRVLPAGREYGIDIGRLLGFQHSLEHAVYCTWNCRLVHPAGLVSGEKTYVALDKSRCSRWNSRRSPSSSIPPWSCPLCGRTPNVVCSGSRPWGTFSLPSSFESLRPSSLHVLGLE